MKKSRLLIVMCALSLSINSTSSFSASFMGLGDLPGGASYSGTAAISADGSVVAGCSWSALGFQAFRWTQATGIVGIGDLPGGVFDSCAQDISGDGKVVVGLSTSSDGQEAFRWTAETSMVGLGDLSGGDFFSRARGISGDGKVIVGEGTSSLGPDEAFRWTEKKGMVGLGDLEGGVFRSIATDTSQTGSVIVGQSISANGWEAFRWTKKDKMVGLGDLSGGDFVSGAWAITPDGDVVTGDGRTATSTTEAFRWTEETGLVPLGDLPGGEEYSRPFAISDDGNIIVGWSKTDAREEAFIWDEINGIRRLHDVFVSEYGLDLTGWFLMSAAAISSDGQIIAGTGINPQGNRESWIARLEADPTSILIDIKPDNEDIVTIDIKREKQIPVAIIHGVAFDATQVDPATVKFGPTGNEASPLRGNKLVDIDSDGDVDLLLTFKTRDTEITCGDTIAMLTGETYGGDAIIGTDNFIVVCP